ncbi:carboxypeptidase regulatory-like domain-containing protein [Actinophytocola gossypii]|uniref:Carboxypeptidase regulatory-like domain-containing protein n=1 Tax=Actinophytocola gossypii TaxID=2812003 RepID=A0ABT2J486_9PSEU|nr:carboxypeptidase regulatory-like domain-containing protein [Actinophytocola gossypii]MCT2582665.1 carboxypeptidase regulatory-like domain-containing protein [Actinophytocola gossypii]
MRTHQSDDELMSEVARLVDELDPPPPGLVGRALFAVAIDTGLRDLDDVEFEVARWAERTLAGVRGGGPGMLKFFVDDLTVMINVTRTGERQRIDGWLVPAGAHGVEVRVVDHPTTATTADEGGRFVLTEVPRGTTQLLVRMHAEQSRTVLTPTVDL